MEYKYKEGEIIKKIQEYVDSTYGQHYVGKQSLQTFDVWESLDLADGVCQATAIKYLMRFGKKEAHNQKDLLKAMHYIILLMYFTENRQEEPIEINKDKEKA